MDEKGYFLIQNKMKIPKEYQTETALKFKDRKHFKKMSNIFFAIILVNVAVAFFIGLKNNVPLWFAEAGIFLTLGCLIRTLESLQLAMAASILAFISVMMTFYNSVMLGESWSAFLLALSFTICFLCLACFIYVYKALRNQDGEVSL